MIEHAEITLKDGRCIRFALLIGWRDEIKQLGLTEAEFITDKVETWWVDLQPISKIEIVEVK